MNFKDYYKVLGVERTATVDEIKKAYRRAARRFHPDVSKEKDAAARMSEINEANEVLSDPVKRASYDQLGNRYGAGQEFSPPPDWQHNFGNARGARPRPSPGFGRRPAPQTEQYSDFFSSLFGGGNRAGAFDHRGTAPTRGEDQHSTITIDLIDAYRGVTKTLSMRNSGDVDLAGRSTGTDRTLDVTVPPGIKEGQQIRLAGQGRRGLNAGPPGDLFLEVKFANDPRYRVVDRDVTMRLPVAPWEAALGATLEVPTPAGRVEITLPPDTQGGRRLRLRGKGIPGKSPGDLFLEVTIVLPPADSDKARVLFQTMARELPFDPRASLAD